MSGKDSDRNPSSSYRLVGELGGAILGGCAIGWYIDEQFGTRYGLITGSIVGIVGGMYNLLKQSFKIIKDEQKRIDESKDTVDGNH